MKINCLLEIQLDIEYKIMLFCFLYHNEWNYLIIAFNTHIIQIHIFIIIVNTRIYNFFHTHYGIKYKIEIIIYTQYLICINKQ